MSTAAEPLSIPTVPYFLVLLLPDRNHAAASAYFAAHVEFIDAMTEQKAVLLGGSFESPVDGAEGAYLLHTATAAEAEQWAAQDPLVVNAVYKPRVVAWHLVGISAAAIDPRLSGGDEGR
ncbi:MAG TPA: YciI family protein [Myxococcota bacterium]|nr:YciI family protein [Myxococcota bacterium]